MSERTMRIHRFKCSGCGKPARTFLPVWLCSDRRSRCDVCVVEAGAVTEVAVFDPATHRLIPNDGSVVVLEREDVEDVRTELLQWYWSMKPQDYEVREHVSRLRARLRSALDACAPEGESDE